MIWQPSFLSFSTTFQASNISVLYLCSGPQNASNSSPEMPITFSATSLSSSRPAGIFSTGFVLVIMARGSPCLLGLMRILAIGLGQVLFGQNALTAPVGLLVSALAGKDIVRLLHVLVALAADHGRVAALVTTEKCVLATLLAFHVSATLAKHFPSLQLLRPWLRNYFWLPDFDQISGQLGRLAPAIDSGKVKVGDPTHLLHLDEAEAFQMILRFGPGREVLYKV